MNNDNVWTIMRHHFDERLEHRGVAPATLSEQELQDARSLFAFDDEVDDLLWGVIDRALSKVLARRNPENKRAMLDETVIWGPTRLGAFADAFDNCGVDESVLTGEHLQLLRDAGESMEVLWPRFEATVAAVEKVIDSLPRLATPLDDGSPSSRGDGG